MKKMMIAAAVVCSCVAAQAASIQWNSNSKPLTDEKGTAITDTSKICLVVMTSADGWATAKDITSSTSISASSKTATKGNLSGTLSFVYDAEGKNNLVDNGNYLALMFKDDNNVLHKLTYTSGADKGDEVEAALLVSGLSNNSSALKSQAIGMTGGFTAAPEPTSGLLLVLGMAGLALRRRRA